VHWCGLIGKASALGARALSGVVAGSLYAYVLAKNASAGCRPTGHCSADHRHCDSEH